ncbi:hypothetical protein AOE01nite_35340 [Acetobacter oeni]|uniref:Uncharacterized protein n=1 Tax=Acetobacter oeni TaxID=304077 RepID=A0A511XQR7_9PROT|nr:hypothetical protein AOE01nite_35340 [Acetobacter oeni]
MRGFGTLLDDLRTLPGCLAHVDKRSDPEPCGGKVEKTHEKQSGFVVADCDAPHLFEAAEHPFYAITIPVARPVCFLWGTAAFA